jgi:hypothetical protein
MKHWRGNLPIKKSLINHNLKLKSSIRDLFVVFSIERICVNLRNLRIKKSEFQKVIGVKLKNAYLTGDY